MTVGLERTSLDPTVERNFQKIDAAVNQAIPSARVFNSANISITTSGVAQALTFDTERWDNGSLHSTSANTSRLTASVAGIYTIGACVDFAANATGIRALALQVNGTTTIASMILPNNGGATVVQLALGGVLYQLAKGDYVEAVVTQTSGGALNALFAANFSPTFWMHRLSGFTNLGLS